MSGGGRGSTAAPAETRANHFMVELGPKDVYHYDVIIIPEVTCKTKCRKIMSLLGKLYKTSHLGNMLLAYDGKKSAFSVGALPFVSEEFIVKLNEQERGYEFKVKIKFAAINNCHHWRQILVGKHYCPQETIRALDVAMRECASNKKSCIIVDGSLYDPGYGKGAVGDGVDYWKGFYQRLQPTPMGRLSVNINVCARAFSDRMFVSDFVAEFLGKDISRPLSDQQRLTVDRALSGVTVIARHGENFVRRYKVQGLTAQPLNQLTFVDVTGANTTVIQYFYDKYDVKLQFPLLPAIQSGTEARPTYLPMEICKLVAGQRYALKLNEKQMTTFLEATCQHPKDREESIRNLMCDGPEVYPLVGQWNMIDLKMINGGVVDYWAIVDFSRQRENAVMHFCDKVVNMCLTKGMILNPEPLIRVHSTRPHNIEKALVDILSQCDTQLTRVEPRNQLQMLFVILPEEKRERDQTYSTIKRVCDTELGIVSQCCKPQHVMKPSRKYLENVALKINVNVGGRNTVLSEGDVTHPSPGDLPSIAARL